MRKILMWASRNRAEEGVHGYYRTEQFQRLLNLIKLVPSGLLVGVMGYSGQGKTAFRRVLAHDMGFRRRKFKIETETDYKMAQLPHSDMIRLSKPIELIKWDGRYYRKLKANVLSAPDIQLLEVNLILIDTPDYGRKDVRLINRDLTQISEFWNALRERRCYANIVVFLQKELVRRQQHFFLLKMTPFIELDFKCEELLQFYKSRFNSYTPFNEESLKEIARLSKAIFRRFQRYIHLTVLDMLQTSKNVVSVEDVKRVITDEELMKDAELEFWDMFRSESKKRTAVKILSSLRSGKEVSQEEIAEALNVNPATISRLIAVLEDYSYVKRRRAERKKLLVSLA